MLTLDLTLPHLIPQGMDLLLVHLLVRAHVIRPLRRAVHLPLQVRVSHLVALHLGEQFTVTVTQSNILHLQLLYVVVLLCTQLNTLYMQVHILLYVIMFLFE
jgi:hypothetical protein